MSAGPDPQPPAGGGDMPQGSALFKGVAIILIFLAAGFFLVRSLGTTRSSSTTTTTTAPAVAPTPGPTVPPTAAPPPPQPTTRKASEVKVLYINATTTAGATKPVADALKPACYAATNPPVYDAAKKDNPAKSRVYFIPSYEAEGKVVAKQLGLTDQDVAQYPTNEKVVAAGGPAFNVLVVVGKDWVTKPPAKVQGGEGCTAAESTAATAKAAAGSGSTSTTKKAGTAATTTTKKKA